MIIQKTTGRIAKFSAGLLVLAMITSCAPNKLSIKTAYSRLDNQIYSNINAYADFTAEQKAWIRESSEQFQRWHRANELPLYASALTAFSDQIQSGQSVTRNDVLRWFDEFESLSNRSFEQLPLIKSVDVMTTLSDEQVRDIALHMTERNLGQREKILEQESMGNNLARIDRIGTSLSQLGIELTSEQRLIIDRGLNRYEGDRTDRIDVLIDWQSQFIALLEKRDQPGFGTAMSHHISTYRQQMRAHYPDRSKRNTETAAQTTAELINSLTDAQRQEMIARLDTVRTVLTDMATSRQTTLL